MLKKFVLLINLFLIFDVHATENNLNEIDYKLSGFVTATYFSNNNWFDNTNKIAINFDINKESYAIRGQLQQPGEHFVRRLTLEKEFFLNDEHEIVLKAGVFPRLDSFYNSVTDAPSTSSLAILPFGEYNHRLINNSTFSAIKGVSTYYSYELLGGHLNTHLDIGTANIEDKCTIHAEAFKTECVTGYKFESNNKNYSIGGTYTNNSWSYLAHVSQLNLNTVLTDKNNRVALGITNAVENINLNYKKIGIKYDNDKCWIQSEIIFSNSTFQAKDSPRSDTYKSKSMYILSGYNWDNQLSTHVVYSYGKSGSGANNIDRGIGITYVYRNTTLSTEYHKGNGKAWVKHYSDLDKWNSWIITVTQRF